MGMLDGRVAICTGAARGVGAEVAKLMAAEGAKIVVVDPGVGGAGEGGDTRPAQATADEIKAAGGEAVANFGSVAKFDDCLQMVQQARDTFGGLHIVFNAAGILRDKMFHNMFPEDWQAVIDVHLTGHFNVNRAAINLFREQNYGRMVLVSSTSGLLGNVGQVNYGTAKMGIVAMARIIAMENQSKGITANVIAPSADTRMTRSVPTPKDPAVAAVREERLRRSRAGAIALAVAGCIPYGLLIVSLVYGPPGGDPSQYGPEDRLDQSLAQLYAILFGVLLWIVIGILLRSAVRTGVPRWAAIATGILFP